MSWTVKSLANWDVSRQTRDRVGQVMSSVASGGGEDLRSPLFRGLKDSDILDGFDRAVASAPVLEIRLQEMEASERAKFGPRSISLPWEARKESVYAYFKDKGGRAVEHLDLSSRGWRLPWSVRRTVDSMVLNTNSGLPFVTRKSNVVDETIASISSQLAAHYPALMWTRTQEGGKTRATWGVPFADTILEQTYFRVMLEKWSGLGHRSALRGPDEVDIAMTRLMNSRRDDETILSIDFSEYDSSLQPRVLRPVLLHLLGQFQNRDAVTELVERILTIGLVTPDGVIMGEHGMPSGSSLTNEGDSHAQYVIASESKAWPEDSVQIQGDDGIYRTDDPDGLISQFEDYGLEVNREKSDQSKEYGIFLRRLYHPAYRTRGGRYTGVYSATRALNRCVHLERWPESSELRGDKLSGDDYFSIRTIAILENAKYHPWFTHLVEYVANNDAHQLRFSSKGLSDYVSRYGASRVVGTKHSLGTIGTEQGFMAFRTVQYLIEKVWRE